MSANPYAAPQARVQDLPLDATEFQPIKLWSSDGRIGRLRYVAYNLAGYFAAMLIAVLVMGLLTAIGVPWLGFVVFGIVLLAYFVLTVLLTIQRCHDVNWSGWLTLLSFVPVVNLVFFLLMWFMPGTNGSNRHGAPPPPNKGSAVLILIASLIGGVFIVGILAAIAIPQYQAYVERARAAGQAQ